MGKIKDISGQKFGRLTAIEIDKEATNSHKRGTYWKCQCECGQYSTVYLGNLTSGKILSCGCLLNERRHEKKIDIINQQFGLLTVLYELPIRKRNRIFYHCRCQCGQECDADGIELRNGHKYSCGCMKTWKKYNLLGKKFGKLTVIEHIENNDINNRNALYKCQCECGNYITVTGRELRQHLITNCGCSNLSSGEEKIFNILKEHNINFIFNEPYFKDLLGDYKPLRYDFIIFNSLNIPIRLIEFDGRQHFEAIQQWGGQKQLIKQQEYDKIKNNYAKTHHIPLIRIPYTEEHNITYSMLMSDKFLIA